MYLLVLQECQSKRHRANLNTLYDLTAESVAFHAFLTHLGDEEISNQFLKYVTNLFVRVLFFRYVKRLAKKVVKNQEARARALRESIRH